MPTTIRMPEVAAGAKEIVLSKWQIEVGSVVKVGDVIAEMETEKAVVDFTSDSAGVVHQILVADGASVEVGSPILILLGAEEQLPAGNEDNPSTASDSGAVSQVTADLQMDDQSTTPPLQSVVQTQSVRLFASPLVRKISADLGVNLNQLSGTGPGGRIVRRDLELYLEKSKPELKTVTSSLENSAPILSPQSVASSQISAVAKQEFSSSYVSIPHSGMRKAIARRLSESKSTVPHFYLSAECEVDSLLDLRKRINESSPVKISVNDFVVKAVGCALIDVPEANVIWQPDAMHKFESADISVAVATEGGLLTPVIRGVEKRQLTNLSLEIAELAARARAGKLRQEELEGGSFAVTNLGMFGTKEFAAILNPPQSGILAVGAASARVVVKDGEMVIANQMTVTLSADHRAVDGALAARWLAAFVTRIENPLSMLV